MPVTILYDSAMRLFGDLVTPEVSAAAERGAWPDRLWRAVEEAGYPGVLPEGAAGMAEAATILRAAGHHAAPIPLAETMLARWLCTAGGVEAPAGALTIGPVEPEARDHLGAVELGGRSAPLPGAIDVLLMQRFGALFRAAQMAGAMEAVLALSIRYANDRVQFGRPIAKFQAIQQQLALLTEQAAAASVAVESAAIAVAADRPSAALAVAAAKIRAGEAAGKVAEIAHQVHGAIGVTHEHRLHRLTRRLWSWRDEFGSESHWSRELGRAVMAAGADALWPTITTG